jgi:hypothetical protein
MDYNGVQYEILQTANPTGWKWVVHLADGRTKTGITSSKGNAVFRAVRAIDDAGTKPDSVVPKS